MFTPNPLLTRHLANIDFFKDSSLVLVDVGARGGIESHWSHYGNGICFLGFEPDVKECERLNNTLGPESNSKFYPVALYKDGGSYTFYHTIPNGSSLYPGNMGLISRFPDEVNFKINKTSTVQTTDFDSFAKKYKITNVDFIKLDTEGSELDILRGAVNQLRKTVLGISCEVLFSPWRGENRTFTEMERFLRTLGFRLYDLDIYHFANKAFPHLNSLITKKASGIAPYGQVIVGQAIFFRDSVAELEGQNLLQNDWDQTRVLKAVSLFEVFGLPDCAIELLNTAEKHDLIAGSERKNVEKFRDYITSGFLGQDTTYEHHLQNLENIKRQNYLKTTNPLRLYLRKVPLIKKLRLLIKKKSAVWFKNNHPTNIH